MPALQKQCINNHPDLCYYPTSYLPQGIHSNFVKTKYQRPAKPSDYPPGYMAKIIHGNAVKTKLSTSIQTSAITPPVTCIMVYPYNRSFVPFQK